MLEFLLRRSGGPKTAACEVYSAKWVIDDYTFDLTSMAHVLGEQLAATECARGGHSRLPRSLLTLAHGFDTIW